MMIDSEFLWSARSEFVDLHFVVKVHPTQGILVHRSALLEHTTATKGVRKRLTQLVEEREMSDERLGLIRLSDLENGDICYLNHRKDSRQDMIGLKQTGRIDFPTVAISIQISVVY